MPVYVLRHEIPSVAHYISIRLAAGLSRKSEEAAQRALPNSLCSVVVYDEAAGTPIGLGRVIGDGGCFYEITDIAVLPAHQKKGVGDMIMRALMEYLRTHAPKTAYVSLMADHGTPALLRAVRFQLHRHAEILRHVPTDLNGTPLPISESHSLLSFFA